MIINLNHSYRSNESEEIKVLNFLEYIIIDLDKGNDLEKKY